jgi:hypothetical protein
MFLNYHYIPERMFRGNRLHISFKKGQLMAECLLVTTMKFNASPFHNSRKLISNERLRIYLQ